MKESFLFGAMDDKSLNSGVNQSKVIDTNYDEVSFEQDVTRKDSERDPYKPRDS